MNAPSAAEITSPPPPLARRFVRLLLGFGVSVAVGLAPFLGKLKIPGFDALLTIYPEDLHYSMIPLSAFLMGLVAVGVQFLHGEGLRKSYLRVAFLLAFAIVLGAFVWLLGVYDERTVRVKIPAVETARTFVIGPRRKPPPDCPCELHWADEECIGQTLNPALMGRCWDRFDLLRGRRTLRNSYMLLTGGFGAVIGLLLLQEGARQAEKAAKQGKTTKQKPKRKKKSPAPPQ